MFKNNKHTGKKIFSITEWQQWWKHLDKKNDISINECTTIGQNWKHLRQKDKFLNEKIAKKKV